MHSADNTSGILPESAVSHMHLWNELYVQNMYMSSVHKTINKKTIKDEKKKAASAVTKCAKGYDIFLFSTELLRSVDSRREKCSLLKRNEKACPRFSDAASFISEELIWAK